VLSFQIDFAKAICIGLNARFKDNDVILCFNILNPINMSSRHAGFQNWGLSEFETSLQYYEVDHSHVGFFLPPLVDQVACKREFLAFKIQCTTKWGENHFRDLWGMITLNPALQSRYPNLLIPAELARVQHVSTATCECVFSVQN